MLHFLRYVREPRSPFLVLVIVFVIVYFVFLLVLRASSPRLRDHGENETDYDRDQDKDYERSLRAFSPAEVVHGFQNVFPSGSAWNSILMHYVLSSAEGGGEVILALGYLRKHQTEVSPSQRRMMCTRSIFHLNGLCNIFAASGTGVPGGPRDANGARLQLRAPLASRPASANLIARICVRFPGLEAISSLVRNRN